jgi:hypothetical protein
VAGELALNNRCARYFIARPHRDGRPETLENVNTGLRLRDKLILKYGDSLRYIERNGKSRRTICPARFRASART